LRALTFRLVLGSVDCLFLDGRDLTTSPYLIRRDSIKEAFNDITEEIDPEKGLVLSRMEIVDEASRGEEFFLRALEEGCEGVMAKSVSDQSVYQAGSRGWLWIKYKRDYRSELSDTLDLVVVGAERITIGDVVSDAELKKIREMCDVGLFLRGDDGVKAAEKAVKFGLDGIVMVSPKGRVDAPAWGVYPTQGVVKKMW